MSISVIKPNVSIRYRFQASLGFCQKEVSLGLVEPLASISSVDFFLFPKNQSLYRSPTLCHPHTYRRTQPRQPPCPRHRPSCTSPQEPPNPSSRDLRPHISQIRLVNLHSQLWNVHGGAFRDCSMVVRCRRGPREFGAVRQDHVREGRVAQTAAIKRADWGGYWSRLGVGWEEDRVRHAAAL